MPTKRLLSLAKSLVPLTFACLFLGLQPATADTLAVNNASFETLPTGGLPAPCGLACAFSSGPIPGWTNSVNAGQFQPGTQAGNHTYFNTLSDGTTSAYSNGGSITQTVADTVLVGVIYTMQVDLGFRNDTPFAGSADLLINGIQYFATGTTPIRGNWSTFTATYTGLASDAGKAITIELNSSGLQGNFDNVRLT